MVKYLLDQLEQKAARQVHSVRAHFFWTGRPEPFHSSRARFLRALCISPILPAFFQLLILGHQNPGRLGLSMSFSYPFSVAGHPYLQIGSNRPATSILTLQISAKVTLTEDTVLIPKITVSISYRSRTRLHCHMVP